MATKKQQPANRQKQEDAALNKLLIWFGIAIGYEAVVLLLKRFYINFSGAELGVALALKQLFQILQWAGPVLTVGALAWLVTSRRKGEAARVPAVCAGALFAVSFTAIVAYRGYRSGVDMLGVVAPAVAILALIYYLYQKEFFCNTLFAAGGIFALWLYRRWYAGHHTRILVCFILGWALLALAAFLAWRLSRQGGKWKTWQVFPAKTSYLPTYVTCGLTALTMAAALLAGATAAYYAIFVLVIWLFCMAVYYTVRLM